MPESNRHRQLPSCRVLPLAVVIAALAAAVPAQMDTASAKPAPKRVVSMNLCTDQLAMLLSAGSQLHSIYYLTQDADTAVLAEEARGYAVNHGLAEEIFLMRPDLVLAGTYSNRATIGLLRRLGFEVLELAPARSFDDIRRDLSTVGAAIGREREAKAAIQAFDRELARITAMERERMLTALYSANSYTSGRGTLESEVVAAAGQVNVGDRLGRSTVRLPLEVLIMLRPELVVSDEEPSKPAQAYEVFRHPALRRGLRAGEFVHIPGRYLLCGAPFTLEAVARLRSAAQLLAGQRAR
ncbi:MAG: ABC transporter substrate-binding protein [Hyphomicrobiaceae bacterium]